MKINEEVLKRRLCLRGNGSGSSRGSDLKTTPQVAANNLAESGDQATRQTPPPPTLFKATFFSAETSHKYMEVSAAEAESKVSPRGDQTTLVTGSWPGLFNILPQDMEGRVTTEFGSTVQRKIPDSQPTASSEEENGRQAKQEMHVWFLLFKMGVSRDSEE